MAGGQLGHFSRDGLPGGARAGIGISGVGYDGLEPSRFDVLVRQTNRWSGYPIGGKQSRGRTGLFGRN